QDPYRYQCKSLGDYHQSDGKIHWCGYVAQFHCLMLHVELASPNPGLIVLEHPIVDAPLGAALVAKEYLQLNIHAKARYLAVPVNVPYWQKVQPLWLNLYPIAPVQC